MRKQLWNSGIIAIAMTVALSADVALGCPMCKQAAESDPRLPNAFMNSILFMLSMPLLLVCGFGLGFWRLTKQRDEMQDDE